MSMVSDPQRVCAEMKMEDGIFYFENMKVHIY